MRHYRMEHRLRGPTYLFPCSDNDSDFTQYRACASLQGSASFNMDSASLTCTSYIVDYISGLSACGSGYFEWDPQTVDLPEQWESIYGGFDDTRAALVRFLLMDRVRFGRRASPRHEAILHLPSTFTVGGQQFA